VSCILPGTVAWLLVKVQMHRHSGYARSQAGSMVLRQHIILPTEHSLPRRQWQLGPVRSCRCARSTYQLLMFSALPVPQEHGA